MPRLIINDENYLQHITPREDQSTGMFARMAPYGSLEFAPPFEVEEIRMEEWPDRIADMERTKSSLKHIWEDSGIGVLNQRNISYCHAFSAVVAAMIQRAAQGLPYIELSASSVGGPVTNWRNAGAYIEDDLKQMVRVGIATTEYVPMLTTNRRDAKPGWEASAAANKLVEWSDIRPRNLKQHGSCLLSRQVVCVGLNYWGHAVTDLALVDLNPRLPATNIDRYGVDFLNSWGEGWGERGCAVRAGSKRFADSVYVPRVMTTGTR